MAKMQESKTISLGTWELSTPQQMVEALVDVVEGGGTGAVRAARDEEGAVHWEVEIFPAGDYTTPAVKAKQNDKLVEFGGVLQALTPEQHDAQFGGKK